jgi:hypothetical protein
LMIIHPIMVMVAAINSMDLISLPL